MTLTPLSHRNTRSKQLRSTGPVLAKAAVMMIIACFTLPLHAGDERAVKQRVPPTYPELAKRMRISGTVRVAATVAPDGSVSATKTVSGNHLLSGAAEEAVHKWKFVTASAESNVEVDVSFNLAQ